MIEEQRKPHKKYLLKIEYNGQAFHGWQIQPNGVTVQEKIERAFFTYLKEPVFLDAASRTDTGVHAEGQLATVSFFSDNTEQLFRSINALIRPHIAILDYKEVPDDFRIRRCTRQKEYQYQCYTGCYKVFLNEQAWWIKKDIDLNKLQTLIPQFLGTHDFRAFRSKGCASPTSIKEIKIFETTIIQQDQNQIINFRIIGNGFLRHMIRIIIGTLIQICENKLEETAIEKAFQSGIRKNAGVTAPAKGLILKKIWLHQHGFEDAIKTTLDVKK